jgi:hypothetical protein
MLRWKIPRQPLEILIRGGLRTALRVQVRHRRDRGLKRWETEPVRHDLVAPAVNLDQVSYGEFDLGSALRAHNCLNRIVVVRTTVCITLAGAEPTYTSRLRNLSSSAAASASVPGIRCPYKSKVTLIEECPMKTERALALTPDAIMKDA